MRIDSYSPSAGALENPGTSKAGAQGKADVQGTATPAASSGGEDRTTLTSNSATVESLVSTAMNSPVVRQETVDSLRQAIGTGQYQLDPAAIADSMLAGQ